VYSDGKRGSGSFRQFMQSDADTVGSSSLDGDAEICMMAADTMEALGVPRGSYIVKVSNRKLLDGILDAIGLVDEVHASKRLIVLRAIDKLDRLGKDAVRLLLGPGRKDDSGDFTKGAGLETWQIDVIFETAVEGDQQGLGIASRTIALPNGKTVAEVSKVFSDGRDDLDILQSKFRACGYGVDRIRIDPSVVRGLEYYTGPVYEVEL